MGISYAHGNRDPGNPPGEMIEESGEPTRARKKQEHIGQNGVGAGAGGKAGPFVEFGQVQPISGKSSPHAASVLEALKTGKHPERLSVLYPPEKPFDRDSFEADPQAYLEVVEPGRVFQTAQPGPGIPALVVQGSGYYRVAQGKTVRLVTKGAPGAPTTFTALDLGGFVESGNLSSVTVRADERGMAAVTFVATPGAFSDVNIIAGCPLASGQARFKVEIESESQEAHK